ncbi:MAG: DUF86 domain-containing protein [Candidatus Hydrogenedentales bacterium]|jgi:uncharacterized protein with HEPN domain
MIEAAREAVSFVEGLDRTDLDSNRQLQLSLVRCVEIVGEAAARLSDDFRSKHPEIPWSDIIGMRNRLVHAYFDIDLNLVWQTVRVELPQLSDLLENLL